ncbi:Phosphoinositol transporter, partial [Globisporangium splendens]
MSALSRPFFGAMKTPPAAPAAGSNANGGASSSFTAALRHRKKQKEAKVNSLQQQSQQHSQSVGELSSLTGSDAEGSSMRLQSSQQDGQANPTTTGIAVSAAGTGGGAGYGSFMTHTTRISRAVSSAAATTVAAVTMTSTSVLHTERKRRPSVVSPATVAMRATTALDTVTEIAPPHVAVRYGDTIRLFAKSKYVSSSDSGGYIGSFEIGKRFLAKKSHKQGELACIPPILNSSALLYRPSTFQIESKLGIEVGTPVSYGDVVVLVDEHGRVWNNKIGTGPTTKNGYFGPRDQNMPGEMYLSFFQLQDDESGSSSETSDDEESFLSFSNLAKTTKTMAETTFGKPTQVELDLAEVALRTVGKVIYYGDRNVVIDVADSNRTRSKFNRVITHYRKNDGLPVQGGYLRCDGRGKTIVFEMHGPPLPAIESIDISDERCPSEGNPSNDSDDGDKSSPSIPEPSIQMPFNGKGSITFGQPINIQNTRRSTVLSVQFSDGGVVKIPCIEFSDNAGEPFHRLVLGGTRPTRILVQATRSQRRRRTVGFRETLRGTYKELSKLFGFVVVTYSGAAFVGSRVFGPVVLLPAMYVGVSVALAVFLVEMFLPGKIVASRRFSLADNSLSEEETLGSWQFLILSLEASEAEQIKSSKLVKDEDQRKMKKDPSSSSSSSLSVPKRFLVAENGNAAKATERYEATLAWRQEVSADGILQTPQLHYNTIKANYKQFLHKHDKLGHPVYFEKIGSINIKQLRNAGTLSTLAVTKERINQDDLFRHYLFAMEFTVTYAANQICSCEACASSDTQKICIVLDARGIGMKDIGGEAFEFIRRCTGTMQKHYPQRSFKIFFVNVPSWFGMAWKGIKPLLSEATRAKTNIVSESDTPSTLMEFIDAENLPEEYGGTCACAGGCDENSAFQQLQKALVQSVIKGEPFNADEAANDAGVATENNNTQESALNGDAQPGHAEVNRLTELSLVQDSETLVKSIPPGSFRDEIKKAGFLLKRSLRHKHFNPIWNRRFFVLHPDSLRFAKAPDAEIFQIVSFTSDTVVKKTNKQNNSFELITPVMANNGHSLLLFAPSPQLLTEWVDAIGDAIAKLGPSGHARVAAASPTMRGSTGEEKPL